MSTVTTTSTVKRVVHRHRVMGFFAGLLMGLGIVLLLFVYGVVPLTWVPLVVAMVVGAVLGVVLASVAPARTPKR